MKEAAEAAISDESAQPVLIRWTSIAATVNVEPNRLPDVHCGKQVIWSEPACAGSLLNLFRFQEKINFQHVLKMMAALKAPPLRDTAGGCAFAVTATDE